MSKREQYRRIRQLAHGTLPPTASLSADDYNACIEVYLRILQAVMDDARRIEYDARVTSANSPSRPASDGEKQATSPD